MRWTKFSRYCWYADTFGKNWLRWSWNVNAPRVCLCGDRCSPLLAADFTAAWKRDSRSFTKQWENSRIHRRTNKPIFKSSERPLLDYKPEPHMTFSILPQALRSGSAAALCAQTGNEAVRQKRFRERSRWLLRPEFLSVRLEAISMCWPTSYSSRWRLVPCNLP